MSEVSLGFKRTLAVSGAALGVGSTVLLGNALADYYDAQPRTNVAAYHISFSGPTTAKLCMIAAKGEKPNCDNGFTTNIINATTTITTSHQYDAGLDRQAKNEAGEATIGLALGGLLLSIYTKDAIRPSQNSLPTIS